MIEVPTLRQLMEAGAHFGHKKEKSYPKAKAFTYLIKDQIYVINLEKTQEQLEIALKKVTDLGEQGKALLIVGTKRQAQDVVEKICKDAGVPYINFRWLGGMLTNFETIRTRLKALENLDNKLNGSDVDKFTKKEKAKLQEEADKLHKMFDGIKDLKRVPDALFIVDVVKEKIAVVEAKKMGIPVIGIADTNANPELIDYPIPANDDARKTIEIITDLIVKSFQEGKKKFTTVKKENEKEEK